MKTSLAGSTSILETLLLFYLDCIKHHSLISEWFSFFVSAATTHDHHCPFFLSLFQHILFLLSFLVFTARRHCQRSPPLRCHVIIGTSDAFSHDHVSSSAASRSWIPSYTVVWSASSIGTASVVTVSRFSDLLQFFLLDFVTKKATTAERMIPIRQIRKPLNVAAITFGSCL